MTRTLFNGIIMRGKMLESSAKKHLSGSHIEER